VKKTILVISTMLLVFTTSFTNAESKVPEKVTIKIAGIAPKGSAPMNLLEEFKNKIKEATNNEVNFKIYPGGIQGDEKDVITKIKFGQLHGGAFTSVGLGKIVPEIRVTDIPFLFKNYEEVAYVRAKLKNKMAKFFDDKGFVVLAWSDIGFVHTFSKEPITRDSLKDLKVWVWGNDVLATTMWQAIGVTPIPLSITDVLTSLSTRLVDTAGTSPFGAVAFRWYKKFNYMAETPSTNPSFAVFVTKKKWAKITPESRKKIREIANGYEDKMLKSTRKVNADCIKILKESGLKFIPASDKSIALVTDMQLRGREALIGKLYSRELLNETLGYLDDYRQMHPESDYQRLQ